MCATPRRLLLLAALLAAIVCLGLETRAALTEEPMRPNIILVSIDTLRAQHTGMYGYTARNTTPNLDRWAKDSVLFESAHVQANESVYSHVAILTSRYASELGPMDFEKFHIQGSSTVAQIMQQNGYQTGGFVAGGHVNHGFGFNIGFQTFRDEWDFGSFFHTMRPAMEWMEKHREKPFFCFLHSYDCHNPWQPTMAFWHLFGHDYHGPMEDMLVRNWGPMRIYDGIFYDYPPGFAKSLAGWLDPRALKEFAEKFDREHLKEKTLHFTDADFQHFKDHYDSSIAYADVWMGLLRAWLAQTGLQSNTVVIVTGDHGEDLMDHKFAEHTGVLNESVTAVPLFVWTPWLQGQGKRVDLPVRSLDISPTILDFAGVAAPPQMEGRSLKPVVMGAGPPAPADDYVVTESPTPQVSILQGAWRLILQRLTPAELKDPKLYKKIARTPTRMELYNLQADPREKQNLIGRGADPKLVDDLVQKLVDWRQHRPRWHAGDGSPVVLQGSSEDDD